MGLKSTLNELQRIGVKATKKELKTVLESEAAKELFEHDTVFKKGKGIKDLVPLIDKAKSYDKVTLLGQYKGAIDYGKKLFPEVTKEAEEVTQDEIDAIRKKIGKKTEDVTQNTINSMRNKTESNFHRTIKNKKEAKLYEERDAFKKKYEKLARDAEEAAKNTAATVDHKGNPILTNEEKLRDEAVKKHFGFEDDKMDEFMREHNNIKKRMEGRRKEEIKDRLNKKQNAKQGFAAKYDKQIKTAAGLAVGGGLVFSMFHNGGEMSNAQLYNQQQQYQNY